MSNKFNIKFDFLYLLNTELSIEKCKLAIFKRCYILRARVSQTVAALAY